MLHCVVWVNGQTLCSYSTDVTPLLQHKMRSSAYQPECLRRCVRQWQEPHTSEEACRLADKCLLMSTQCQSTHYVQR